MTTAENNLKNNTIEMKDIYSESCVTLRHYSNITLSVRLVTIIQGLLILGISGKLILDNKIEYLFATSLFGLIFTLILILLHYNYYRYFNFIVDYLCELEEKIGSDSNMDGDMLWTRYKVVRNGKIIHFLPFVLIGGSFIILMIYAYCNK